MALRPKAFSIPSTTELKVTFTNNLSTLLSKDNFVVQSLNGAVDDLSIQSIDIDGPIVYIKTNPQVSSNYYLLKFIDIDGIPFADDKGNRLIDDSVSRELFFVGIDTINPIRDKLFERVPSFFDLENSNIKNILSAQAEEIYTAQKKLGELLSDNYISVEVKDEFRVRTAGATDRIANEQAYEVSRVSKFPTGIVPKFEKIEYTSDNLYSRIEKIPFYPISLQQRLVEDEEIIYSNPAATKGGFLIELQNKNVIKLLSLKIIKESDEEDCNGDIGTEYLIERYKYTLNSNYYDQDYAFEYSKLESNQILLSEFGNISSPQVGDKIIVSYLYKDTSKSILADTVAVSRVEFKQNESVPSSTNRFFLGHAPVVNSSNEIPTRGGVSFYTSENINQIPFEFSREVPYNISKLPTAPGEYTVNYSTGEVILVGDSDRNGTARNNFVATYYWRREFSEGIDYSISGNDFVANPSRNLAGKEAEISLNYETVYKEDEDYRLSSHIEVFGEQVENRLSQAFSVETKNSPITNVYRILNQTTGEVYSPLYHSSSEIFFSGSRSPEIKSAEQEQAKFKKILNEKLIPSGEFIIPAFQVTIISAASNNSILFEPAIPAELINTNSEDYFIREQEIDNNIAEVDDINIKFFGNPNANNLISSLAISATATAPSAGTTVTIGTKGLIIPLEEENILNQNLDSIGYNCNTSVAFSDESIFNIEKFFEEIPAAINFVETSQESPYLAINVSKKDILYNNLSKLRKVGDYSIDYKNGVVYLSISSDSNYDIGFASYNCAKHVGNNNIIAAISASKKAKSTDSLHDSNIIYNNIGNTNDDIFINDLDNSWISFDNETEAFDLDGNRKFVCEVLEDYTAIVPFNIANLNIVTELVNVTSSNLDFLQQDDRIADKSCSELKASVLDGGYNLNGGKVISFVDNAIDLKRTISKRAYVQNDGTFVATINDSIASAFYSCKRVKTGVELFNSDLNITKVSEVQILNSIDLTGTADISVVVDDITEIDADNDYLLDSSGNRFKILSVDQSLSVINVESPAENNILALVPNEDLTGENTKIIIRADVSLSEGVMTLTLPEDVDISSGELLEIKYLTEFTPSLGTPLFIDYRHGNVYVDYNYVYDKIAVWYEYGDNSIDWSISNTLSEGDEYYITYKYGANREALRRNFGTLTQVPFFEQFPIEVDRELYRNGLEGTLQAFPKGPTIPAFKGLVESFTDIEPTINELNFGSWILGRDYMRTADVDVSGNLTFSEGKFDSGLLFDEQTVVSIPAVSSLSVREGTLESWIRPNWSGINNDATLTFYLDGIGKEKYILSIGDDMFSNGWQIAPIQNIEGINDLTNIGFRFSNYKSSEDTVASGRYGAYRYIKNLNKVTNINSEINLKINEFFAHINRNLEQITLENDNNISKYFITDKSRLVGIDFNLAIAYDDEENNITLQSLEPNLTFTDIPNFKRGHRTRSCSCSITNRVDTLSNFNEEVIQIDLDSEVSLALFKDNFNIIDNSSEAFVIIDQNNDVYQILSFIQNGNETDTIPDSFNGIIVKRYPVNNQKIKQANVDEINALLPIGDISLFAKIVKSSTDNTSNNDLAFENKSSYIVNWTNYHTYKFDIAPVDNIVKLYINGNELKSFYTDYKYIDEQDLIFDINNNINSGVWIGCFNENILSSITFKNIFINFFNRYDLTDIFIGKNAYNPKRLPFSINKDDSINLSVGLPANITNDEGIFIGFDELCTSPLSDSIGQWIFRTRSSRIVSIPSDVVVSGLNNYSNIYIQEGIEHLFSGYILTDGEFGSVVRSYRDEINGNCASGVVCDSTFRYCANELLQDYGWNKIEESDSDIINLTIGGRDTSIGKWRLIGDFLSSCSAGIYRIGPSNDNGFDDDFNGNKIITGLPCSGGQTEYYISMKVNYDSNIINTLMGRFSGATTGNLIGTTPIHINDQTINLKISLAVDQYDSGLIAVIDANNNSFLDLARFSWNDNGFHEYKVNIDYQDGTIDLYCDDLLISRTFISDFTTIDVINETISIHLFDSDLIDTQAFHSALSGNIIDIDTIFFTSRYEEGDAYLESSDVLIHTDSRIDFEFYIDESDGYVDIDYDGYDGYEEVLVGVDEMLITSDRQRYIFDSAKNQAESRVSLFKDGKGFLNFRIFDKNLNSGGEPGIYNIATNIKHLMAGELHHVGVSWKLNSLDKMDEMHLFLDGQEVPNIYKFGGVVPVRLNEKYSDVSKETIQDFLVRNITYPEIITDGTVSAGLSTFSSSYIFTEDSIGKSIIIHNALIAESLIGKKLVIKSISNGSAIFGTGDDLETFVFDTSDSNIEFSFAPYSENLITDVKNTRFYLYRVNSAQEEFEMGGVLYQIIDGEIDEITNNVENPKFRVNVDTRYMEFIEENEDCLWTQSVYENDIDVYIKTYGLNIEICKEKINLSGSSYHTDNEKFSGLSALKLHSKEPTSLDDVKITRVILDRTSIDIINPTITDDVYYANFEIDLSEDGHKVSSESGAVSKQNLGRYLSVIIDSDNINFCEFDGYGDGYIGDNNTITIYGETIDGSNFETFNITKNGKINGEKLFKQVSSVEGTLNIIDPNYFELGVLSIEESNYLTISNNGGDYLDIYDYRSGHFILMKQGSNGAFPFELHSGYYKIEYPSYLSISVDSFGDKLYIGTDYNKQNFFGGIIDEFRIISEMSLDTRSFESGTLGTRSITDDYYRSIPFCPDEQTLALIHFNDPYEKQLRRLRNTEFLNEDTNFKYKLDRNQLNSLMKDINNEQKFVSKMINYNFSIDDAEKVYIESHKADGGPIWNEANSYKNFENYILAENSVNDAFGSSAFFISGSNLLIENNDNYFSNKEGTIEFWVSPAVDTIVDEDDRYYIDLSGTKRISVKSKSSTKIELPNAASKIISVKLLTRKKKDTSLYENEDGILFDEIIRSEISGRLEGGTGTEKDFSIGSDLSADGRIINLAEPLPGNELEVVVLYAPIDSYNDRVSIFKNKESQIVFLMTVNGIDNLVSIDVNWKKNTWHKIKCTYRVNSTADFIRMQVDGYNSSLIKYGTGLVYGTGNVYGQYLYEDGGARNANYFLPLNDNLRLISIGSDIYNGNSARARMDNIRFSREARPDIRDASGNLFDPGYSDNINTVYPMISDDITTLLIDFDSSGEQINNFITVIDPNNGIFNFSVDIIDNFDKVIGINNGKIEDLIVQLINILKPAHSNAYVKFKKSTC